jgi:hypothetical protein
MKRVLYDITKDLSEKHLLNTDKGTEISSGLLIRRFQRYDDVEVVDTKRVAFLTTDFLTLRKEKHTTALDGRHNIRALAQSAYGPYANVNFHNKSYGTGSGTVLGLSPQDHVPHVSQIWCLLIGSGN